MYFLKRNITLYLKSKKRKKFKMQKLRCYIATNRKKINLLATPTTNKKL